MISTQFPNLAFEKRIVSLDIPDIFRYNDPVLIDLIKKGTKKWLD